MLLNNLETQQAKTRQEIHLLEEELADKKEHLLKIVFHDTSFHRVLAFIMDQSKKIHLFQV